MLTSRQIGQLLSEGRQYHLQRNPRATAKCQIQFAPHIPGYKVPLPIEGEFASRINEIDQLFVDFVQTGQNYEWTIQRIGELLS